MAFIDTKHLFECDTCRSHRNGGCDTWCECGEMYRPDMTKIPTADVEEVKHGYWATDEEDIEWGNSLKRKYCSVCKTRPHFDKDKREFVLTARCPNCGAKMDGKDDEK